jgi:hypothetical protein
MSEQKRALFVVAAFVIGAVGGYYIGGGRATPGAILENPDLLTAQGNGPVLYGIVGALALAWLVNRWIEHRPSDER